MYTQVTYYHIYTSSRKKRTNHSLVFIKIKWPLHVCSKMWKQKKMCVCGFHEIFHPVKSLVSIICSDFINHHRHFYEFSTTNSRIVKKKLQSWLPSLPLKSVLAAHSGPFFIQKRCENLGMKSVKTA